MREYSVFTNYKDYGVPLLETLAALPAGEGTKADVLAEFDKRFGRYSSASDRASVASGTEAIWSNRVRWWRLYLKHMGLLEAPRYGTWRISEEGRKWLEEHPDTLVLSPSNARPVNPDEPRLRREATGKKRPPPSERSRARAHGATEVEIATAVLRGELAKVGDILAGRSPLPGHEHLCDLVQLCYTLGLYAKASALFSLVDGTEVHPWYYERTRKVARLCALKAAE